MAPGLRRVATGLALVAGVCVLLGRGPAGSAAAPQRPNLILISLDTTRADALSCYGSPPDMPTDPARRVTPTIDALAEQGLRFEAFYSHAPTTLNAHTSMLSGLDPHDHDEGAAPATTPTRPHRRILQMHRLVCKWL